ncbi:MAG: hypothetical protein PHO01_06240 [Desulfotomaculaceae bacterium]|nr:hypothetical protein [Desulfotomaculaceae bacterium]
MLGNNLSAWWGSADDAVVSLHPGFLIDILGRTKSVKSRGFGGWPPSTS